MHEAGLEEIHAPPELERAHAGDVVVRETGHVEALCRIGALITEVVQSHDDPSAEQRIAARAVFDVAIRRTERHMVIVEVQDVRSTPQRRERREDRARQIDPPFHRVFVLVPRCRVGIDAVPPEVAVVFDEHKTNRRALEDAFQEADWLLAPPDVHLGLETRYGTQALGRAVDEAIGRQNERNITAGPRQSSCQGARDVRQAARLGQRHGLGGRQSHQRGLAPVRMRREKHLQPVWTSLKSSAAYSGGVGLI